MNDEMATQLEAASEHIDARFDADGVKRSLDERLHKREQNLFAYRVVQIVVVVAVIALCGVVVANLASERVDAKFDAANDSVNTAVTF